MTQVAAWEWVRPFVGVRAWMVRPFALDGHAVATDSKTLVFHLAGADGLVELEAEEKYKIALRAAVSAADSAWPPVCRNALAAWAGSFETATRTECEECGGIGEVGHDCGCALCTATEQKCDACNGSGKREHRPESRPGKWFGHVINRNRLAGVLSQAPSGPIRATFQRDRFYLSGEGWRAVIIEDDAGAEPVPSFPPEAA